MVNPAALTAVTNAVNEALGASVIVALVENVLLFAVVSFKKNVLVVAGNAVKELGTT